MQKRRRDDAMTLGSSYAYELQAFSTPMQYVCVGVNINDMDRNTFRMCLAWAAATSCSSSSTRAVIYQYSDSIPIIFHITDPLADHMPEKRTVILEEGYQQHASLFGHTRVGGGRGEID